MVYEVEIYQTRNLSSIKYLCVQDKKLIITKQGAQPQVIDWKDILAINHVQSEEAIKQIHLLLFIKRKKFFKKEKRYEQMIRFYVLAQNVNLLKKKVRHLLTQSPVQEPKILFYFNPAAGSNSRRHLNTTIDFLNKTHFKHQIITTTGRNFCKNHLNQLKNPQQYWAVAIVSGDGLVHQYLNSNSEIPMTHIPGGSGNAVAKTQAERSGQEVGDKQNMYLAIKGKIKKYNLAKYELQKQPNPIYSILSLEWGIIADADIESQVLRILGSIRFDLWTFWRIISLRRYRARISYSQVCNNLPNLNDEIQNQKNQFVVRQDSFTSGMFLTIPYITEQVKIAPIIDLDEETIDMQLLDSKTNRYHIIKYFLNVTAGTHFDIEKKKKKDNFNFIYKKIKSYRIEPLGKEIGRLGIDGQMYQGQKLQASIAQKKAKIFTLYDD